MPFFRVWFSIVLGAALAMHLPARGQFAIDSMAQRTLACTACHGQQGRAGPDGYYPRLAGKPAQYIYNQLVNFKDGRRHYGLMTGLLEPLSEGYLLEIAKYFSGLDLPYPAPASLLPAAKAPVVERGRTLALQGDSRLSLPACTHCHGNALTGVMPAVPGLLGLPRDYLIAQLGGWRTGQRKALAPDCMAHVAQRLSPQDISAVATWLSNQAVPQNAKPRSAPVDGGALASDLQCGSITTAPTPAKAPLTPDAANATKVQQGAYLAQIGNCALCHTQRGMPAYAGGRNIETPFGAVYSSNITPESTHGIGRWSADDFWRAMHHGKSRDGRLLNPAFPYTSFTHIKRADSDALFAYLQTVAPVAQPNVPHRLTWPLGTQAALAAWRFLYFTPAAEKAGMSRGAYLVNGLGHCQECHAGRNLLGGITAAGLTRGGVLPKTGWYAPPLDAAHNPALARWSEAQLVAFLKTGISAPPGAAQVSGPMAEVVLHGTQYLHDVDVRAIANFLHPAQPAGQNIAPPNAANGHAQTASTSAAHGRKLYERHCAECHGKSGEGVSGAFPPLAGNPAVVRSNTNNLVLTLIQGGFAPATAGNPRPYGMPPFLLTLSDADMASVLTYIRTTWGNKGGSVSEFDINKLRTSLTP